LFFAASNLAPDCSSINFVTMPFSTTNSLGGDGRSLSLVRAIALVSFGSRRELE
jgi:hypothetical protein